MRGRPFDTTYSDLTAGSGWLIGKTSKGRPLTLPSPYGRGFPAPFRHCRGLTHMTTGLLIVQILNGLQLGILLFLVAAGLTLVFGVMDFINLAHGVQYMLGAYLAVTFVSLDRQFRARARAGAGGGACLIGLALEFLVFRHLYERDHLDQVLATFGLILLLNQGVKMVWGAAPLSVPVPGFLAGNVALLDGILYPTYRFALIGAGLAVGALLWFVVEKTRTGMLLRAGASNAPMVSALGVDIRKLFMIVFAFGTMLAAFAGAMAAPILSVEPGMGDNILILAFVVIVVGGIGSIRGAFVGALIVGLVDTLGRSFDERPAAPVHERALGEGGRRGSVLDADLSGDGDRAVLAARGPAAGEGAVMSLATPTVSMPARSRPTASCRRSGALRGCWLCCPSPSRSACPRIG